MVSKKKKQGRPSLKTPRDYGRYFLRFTEEEWKRLEKVRVHKGQSKVSCIHALVDREFGRLKKLGKVI